MMVPHDIRLAARGDAVDARRVTSPGQTHLVTRVTSARLDGVGDGLNGCCCLVVVFVVMFLVMSLVMSLFVMGVVVVSVGRHSDQRDGDESRKGRDVELHAVQVVVRRPKKRRLGWRRGGALHSKVCAEGVKEAIP